LTDVVVFPTPPFWLATAIDRIGPPLDGGRVFTAGDAGQTVGGQRVPPGKIGMTGAVPKPGFPAAETAKNAETTQSFRHQTALAKLPAGEITAGHPADREPRSP